MRAGLANLALTLAAIAIGLCGLELATRVVFGVQPFATTNFVAQALDIVHANSGNLTYDDQIGWRLVDNTRLGDGFNTGPYGLRMNDGAIRQPPANAILTAGDSFTAGSGVRDEETWPAQVEAIVGSPVLNASSGGWGSDQIVLNAERLVPILRPKTLVISFLADDSLRNSYSTYGGGQKPYFTIEDGKLALHNVPVPLPVARVYGFDVWRTVFGHSLFVFQAAKAIGKLPDWIGSGQFSYLRALSNEDGVKVSCLLMDKLAAIKQSGVRVIFMVQYNGPASMDKEAPWYGPPVLACAQERGLETIDTFPALHELALTDHERFVKLWIDEYGQMGHMTKAGNAFIAGLVAKALSTGPKLAGPARFLSTPTGERASPE
jgi:hypothetical protein